MTDLPQPSFMPKSLTLPYFKGLEDRGITDGSEAEFRVIKKNVNKSYEIKNITDLLPFEACWYIDGGTAYKNFGLIGNKVFWWFGNKESDEILGSGWIKKDKFPDYLDMTISSMSLADKTFVTKEFLGPLRIYAIKASPSIENIKLGVISGTIFRKENEIILGSFTSLKNKIIESDQLLIGKYIFVTTGIKYGWQPDGWSILYRLIFYTNDSLMFRVAQVRENINREIEDEECLFKSVINGWEKKYGSIHGPKLQTRTH